MHLIRNPAWGSHRATSSPSNYTNMLGWWKASSLALNDGDAIGTLNDSSAAGRNALQLTAGNKPTFRTGKFLSKPGISIDTDDSMSFSIFPSAITHTVLAVVRDLAYNTSNPIIRKNGSSSKFMLSSGAGGPFAITVNDPAGNTKTSNNLALTNTGAALVGYTIASGGNINFYENKTNRGGPAWGGVTNMPYDLLFDQNLGPSTQGVIAEVCAWDRVLTPTEIADLYDNYFAPTYGI